MRLTPDIAKTYLFIAAVLIALPSFSALYRGQTGKLLVATSQLEDQIFGKSVVYIVDHDLFSAYGFIVNVPIDDQQAEIMVDGESMPISAYLGGPIEEQGMFAIFGLDKSRAPKVLLAKDKRETLDQARAMFGFAGWGPLQLNYEIFRGAWHSIDFDAELVFETPPEKMWAAARRRAAKGGDVHSDEII